MSMRSVVTRLTGQLSGVPTGVSDQFTARAVARATPSPEKMAVRGAFTAEP